MFVGSEAVSTKALKELLEYKETGLTPQDIKEMDKMYLEKCKEVNALVKTCERLIYPLYPVQGSIPKFV